jgi:hypothetical protein
MISQYLILSWRTTMMHPSIHEQEQEPWGRPNFFPTSPHLIIASRTDWSMVMLATTISFYFCLFNTRFSVASTFSPYHNGYLLQMTCIQVRDKPMSYLQIYTLLCRSLTNMGLQYTSAESSHFLEVDPQFNFLRHRDELFVIAS